MALQVTLADVTAYAPDAPTPTQAHLDDALDRVETRLEQAAVTLPADSRQERAAKRAVCALTLAFATRARALSSADDVGTTVKIEGRGATTVTAEHTTALAEAALAFEADAALHLADAGLPRPARFTGVTR